MCFKYSVAALLLIASASAASVAVRASNSYYFGSNAVSFIQAWAYCKNADLKFTSLPSSAQNDALASALKNIGAPSANFWIGGINLKNGFLNKWYWVDGQEDFNYVNWKADPCASYNGDLCAAFSYLATNNSGSWVAQNCSNANYFICQ